MSDPSGADHGVRGGTSGVRGANWGDPARRPNDVDESQRRQRNALIGLAVASAIVLLIGGVAYLAARPGPTTASIDSSPASAVVSTTVASTTTSTTTTTTTTSTTTTLPVPVVAVADAGPDLAVDAGGVVTLTARAVTDGATDDEVRWRQLAGPDVTAGVGALGGSEVSFGAPDDVVTLEFELVVTSADRAATAPEAVDAITVRVFEDADAAIFVDAERGDDGGDGTMESPVRSLVEASRRAQGGADLYVRSVGSYTETETIRLGTGSSLYGGFDDTWTRDRAARARIEGAAIGIDLEGDGDRHVSAVDVTAGAAEPGRRAIGVRVADGETVTIEDSRVVAGTAGDAVSAAADGAAGASVGVLVIDTGEIRIERSTVNGGAGGDGVSPGGAEARARADSGEDAEGIEAASGADAEGDAGADAALSRSGGDGGNGATIGAGGDAPGELGGAGGDEEGADGEPGRGGGGGSGGRGGDGGRGPLDGDDAIPVGASGSAGDGGASGAGAGGGGGGASGADVGLAAGGAGGGGGAGGRGGVGGDAGGGGGGSIGVWAVGVNRVVIVESLVAAGRGGDGAAGGAAGAGGAGGAGGSGAEGGDGIAIAGNGGGGGGGGAAGSGGAGGGGAGGPSYGMLTSDVDAVEITATTIRGGAGGAGADGGAGGIAGLAGAPGSGRAGGDGGAPGGGVQAEQGRGASGGSSFGWFDSDGATQTFRDASFIEGNAGPGGRGSTSGETGLEADANVDAGG